MTASSQLTTPANWTTQILNFFSSFLASNFALLLVLTAKRLSQGLERNKSSCPEKGDGNIRLGKRCRAFNLKVGSGVNPPGTDIVNVETDELHRQGMRRPMAERLCLRSRPFGSPAIHDNDSQRATDTGADMKNIVVCCDGTANEFAADNTNVVKLCYGLATSQSQAICYHPGLGTMEPAGALTQVGRRFTRFLGRAIGFGLARDVSDAYTFVMNRFEPGDRIFLFGFSRGAYTVRAVAALINMYGLLPPGNDALVPYAIRLLVAINRKPQRDPKDDFSLAKEFSSTFSRREVRIHFLGVWDTVSSVGWISNPLRLPYTARNPIVDTIRHAVSIDERRAFFRTNLFEAIEPGNGHQQDLRQVWFAGVHSDVGGGYKEEESGLSKIALQWMLDEAREKGLMIDDARYREVLGMVDGGRFAPPDPHAKRHVSLQGPWWFAEILPKKRFSTGKWYINLARRRTIPEGAELHKSVQIGQPIADDA